MSPAIRQALQQAISEHPQLGRYLANPEAVAIMPDATHYGATAEGRSTPTESDHALEARQGHGGKA